MRVCHVVHSLKVGGAEVLVANLTRSLRGSDVEVVVACLDEIGVLGEQLRSEGTPIRCAGRRPGIDLGLFARMRGVLRDLEADVVHAHQYTPWFYGGTAAATLGLPLVFTEHGRHQPDRPKRRRLLFNRWLLPRTAAVTAVSGSIRDALIANEGFPASRVEVVYNGVDHHRLVRDDAARRDKRAELGLDGETLAVGTAGRLVEVKNHPLLLRALARWRDAGAPRFRAFLAGSGPRDADLRRLAEDLGLAGCVEFLGERDDVPELLSAWDVFVLSSFSEGTSVTLLEAMSTSLPVVATAVGGNPELIEDGRHGRLVPSDDDVALADALAALAADPGARASMGQAARAEVEGRFSFAGMRERFCELYEEVRP